MRRLASDLRRFSAPSAALYDAVAGPVLEGFFDPIARAVARRAPRGEILEVGAGPGRLAVKIALAAPEARVAAIDVAPEMLARARARAARAGVAQRVDVTLADAAALPFADARFDVVVSTFSLHHWDDRAAGLAEIHRVLRRDGVAWIYDVPPWIGRFERRAVDLAALARRSPFADRGAWRAGVASRVARIPLVVRLELVRRG